MLLIIPVKAQLVPGTTRRGHVVVVEPHSAPQRPEGCLLREQQTAGIV